MNKPKLDSTENVSHISDDDIINTLCEARDRASKILIALGVSVLDDSFKFFELKNIHIKKEKVDDDVNNDASLQDHESHFVACDPLLEDSLEQNGTLDPLEGTSTDREQSTAANEKMNDLTIIKKYCGSFIQRCTNRSGI